MKNNLKIRFYLGSEDDKIEIKNIIIELVKLWINRPEVKKENDIIEITIKTFEVSFNLDAFDVIIYTIFKCNIKNIKKVDYKMNYYEDYEYLFHYFLLDFKLKKEEDEYLKSLLRKLIETPYFISKKEYLNWKIRMKNKNMINKENLESIFSLDINLKNISNQLLKDKFIYFVLNTRSRQWKYIFI